MKAYRGSRSITPPTLNLGTRLRWEVSFMPRLLYPTGKICQYLLKRKLGRSQSQSGCFCTQVIPWPCWQSKSRLSSPQCSHCIAPKLRGFISHKTVILKQHYLLSGSVKPCPKITEWHAHARARARAHTHTHTHTHLFGPWTESTPIFSERSVRPTLKFSSLSMLWMCAHVW